MANAIAENNTARLSFAGEGATEASLTASVAIRGVYCFMAYLL
jgi:hypothetical protein